MPTSLHSLRAILGVLLFACTPLHAVDFDDSQVLHIDYPTWFVNRGFNDLHELIAEAKTSDSKGVFVLFTTEGCSYCEKFISDTLGDAEIAAIMQDDFRSHGFELFDDTEMIDPAGQVMPIREYAKAVNVQFSPTLIFYDTDGQMIYRKTGYLSTAQFRSVLDYIREAHHVDMTYREYLASVSQSRATALDRQQALSVDEMAGKVEFLSGPPYKLLRGQGTKDKPLLVIFDKADCEACRALYRNTLKQPDVVETLARFDVIRLGANDTTTEIIKPDGDKSTPADWYTRSEFTAVPAYLFISETGDEVLRTDTLVLRQRMMNSLNFVLDKAYVKGWNYQRFARSQAIERHRNRDKAGNAER